MPILSLDDGYQIPFVAGHSVRAILDGTDRRVRAGCLGTGACGLCKIRILGGSGGDPSVAEIIHLGDGELKRGVRLACQVRPSHDLSVEILAPARKSELRSPIRPNSQNHLPPDRKGLPEDLRDPLGIAMDLGTTSITISVFNLSSGQFLAGRYWENPQGTFGSDVVTRLATAVLSEENARTLRNLVLEILADALNDIADREAVELSRIVRLTVVGNTAMLALFSGKNYRSLLDPENWARPVDCEPDRGASWVALAGLHPRFTVEIVPPLAGFVGSDLLSGVLATDLADGEPCQLLVDFGTNTEIALWDGTILWATSVAGGPAFEGSGVSCGVPADTGAISGATFERGELKIEVIGGGAPTGVCGSGLVDLMAILVESGRLDEVGRIASPMDNGECVVTDTIRISKRDIDVFQRAKAAVGVGVSILMKKAGVAQKDVKRICLAGAFGQSLNVAHAGRIGLLPDIAAHLVESRGNTALCGCEFLLLSETAKKQLDGLRERTRLVNLSNCEDFDDYFCAHLYLRPIQGEAFCP